jgi:methoxymalonate biosynthesis acyl carrier protein
MHDNKPRIRAFLARFHRNLDLRDDMDIFALGFINSLMAMQLVMFVEKEFEVPIENEDLDLDNFKSVNAIAHLVERKQGAQASA